MSQYGYLFTPASDVGGYSRTRMMNERALSFSPFGTGWSLTCDSSRHLVNVIDNATNRYDEWSRYRSRDRLGELGTASARFASYRCFRRIKSRDAKRRRRRSRRPSRRSALFSTLQSRARGAETEGEKLLCEKSDRGKPREKATRRAHTSSPCNDVTKHAQAKWMYQWWGQCWRTGLDLAPIILGNLLPSMHLSNLSQRRFKERKRNRTEEARS